MAPSNEAPSKPYTRGPNSPLYLVNDKSKDYQAAHDDNVRRSAASLTTPAKPSSRAHKSVPSGTVRQETEKHLASTLVARRWTSEDLVEHAFGTIVSISLAARILFTLLRHKFLHVELKHKPEGQTPVFQQHELWVEACVEAAADVEYRLSGKAERNSYVWTWPGMTTDGTFGEAKAAQLFNFVGAFGYAIAGELDPEFVEKYSYRNRFALLMKQGAFRGWEGQDSRPDLIGLPIDAFVSAEATDGDNERYVDVLTPKDILERLDTHSQAQTCSGKKPPGASITFQTDLRRALKAMLATDSDLSTYQVPPAGLFSKVDSSRIHWAGLVATGEVKKNEPTDSIRQEFIYMECQRLAQPYLRYVLGFSGTQSECALIRADAIGAEECRLKKSNGWGVLDIVRLSLGFVVADERLLGVHPFFELEKELGNVNVYTSGEDFPQAGATLQSGSLLQTSTTTDNAEASGSVSGSTSNKRKAESQLQPQRKRAKMRPECRARKAIFVTIPDVENPARKTRFYLDYIADNRGGLVGRATRVWCVYQEILDVQAARDAIRKEDLQEALETLGTKGRVFVGPYALKLQNVDMQSASYKDDVQAIIKLKAEEDPEGSKFVLVPQSIWKGAKILDAVRGFTSNEDVPARVREQLSERQEVFSLSLYKRTLSHYKSFAEVGKAISDAFQAILWLDKHRIVHRDVSSGNVLLNQEEPTSFVAPRPALADGESILLCRRQPSQQDGVYGLLHDLDMAYICPESVAESTSSAHPSPIDPFSDFLDWANATRPNEGQTTEQQIVENSEFNHARFRTGTPPYMALEILLGDAKTHLMQHDAESLFYVLYLFPLDAHPPPDPPVYPQELRQDPIFFEQRVEKWVKGTDFMALGQSKAGFFVGDKGIWASCMAKDRNAATLWPKRNDERMQYWMKMVMALRRRLWVNNTSPTSSGVDVQAMADEMKRLCAEMSV
ncbi:hypothetical protein NMY22_g9609 [Coprinellus aureogranulatus]|nr:hypothetical protein NMY22_g9609 [Coprinellus aureogranulatus]